jgi:hypothetical protein
MAVGCGEAAVGTIMELREKDDQREEQTYQTGLSRVSRHILASEIRKERLSGQGRKRVDVHVTEYRFDPSKGQGMV